MRDGGGLMDEQRNEQDEKKYGDPVLGKTLPQLKAIAPLAATVNGLQIEGPSKKVAAVFAAAGCLGDLVAHIETLTAERDKLKAEAAQTARNRDMWKDQCAQQAERLRLLQTT